MEGVRQIYGRIPTVAIENPKSMKDTLIESNKKATFFLLRPLLMQYGEEFDLQLPLADSFELCNKVVDDLGWKIIGSNQDYVEQGGEYFVCREPTKILTFHNTIIFQVFLRRIDDQQTQITLVGFNIGLGPIQKWAVKAQVARLRDSISSRESGAEQ